MVNTITSNVSTIDTLNIMLLNNLDLINKKYSTSAKNNVGKNQSAPVLQWMDNVLITATTKLFIENPEIIRYSSITKNSKNKYGIIRESVFFFKKLIIEVTLYLSSLINKPLNKKKAGTWKLYTQVLLGIYVL